MEHACIPYIDSLQLQCNDGHGSKVIRPCADFRVNVRSVGSMAEFTYMLGKLQLRASFKTRKRQRSPYNLPCRPRQKYRYCPTLSLNSAPHGREWLTSCPGRLNPGKETRYPLYRRLGGP